jgi:hypothetical protein
MPKKNPSRLVAGQERARARAKRKARYAGPAVVATSARSAEAEADLVDLVDALDSDESPAGTEAEQKPEAVAPVARAARTQRGARSTVAVTQRRRATQAMDVAVGPRLRSEILRIGIVAALVGGALAAIKLATDIGA